MIAHGITRKAWFWISCIALFAASILFSIKYFSQALPLAQITISMDRQEALDQARIVADKYHLGPQKARQASSFETDTETQFFIELEAGGKKAFNSMLKEKIYEPYTWQVRRFYEGEHNEVTIAFTPQGTPYGFVETITETAPGAQLTKEDARTIAEQFAQREWLIDLTPYTLAQASQEKRTGGRIDHTFVYERTDRRIGAGTYRLKIVVSGDKISEITPFVKVPDDFNRRYQEMRAANKAIASTAGILAFLLYILGGAFFGFYFLSKSGALLWRMPLIVAGIISALQFATSINNLPSAWLAYDTALSAHNFLIMYILQAFLSALAALALMTIALALAEGLTRRAFGNHPQFWKIWTRTASSSTAVLGRTVAGYLFVGFDLALVICIYLFANRYLNWWWPTDILADPNILATRLPGLSSISSALTAGFLEEALFRAVPLACAALLGNRFGKRSWWIAGAFILQAFIFGAAHAEYPAQPAYARMLELIIPSFMFGGMYLVLGLLPAILSHTLYDLVLMSLPLFVTSSQGMWIHQLLIVCAALTPLIVIVIARLRTGKFSALDARIYNSAWQAPVMTQAPPSGIEPTQPKSFSSVKVGLPQLLLLAALGCGAWGALTKFHQDTPALTLTREQAIEQARAEITRAKIDLTSDWQALSILLADHNTSSSHKFVWQADKNLYKKLIGTYLLPPAWLVRFVRFQGTVEERAEEYRVYITRNGTIVRVEHQLPEAFASATISQTQARNIAEQHINTMLGIKPHELTFISAQSDKKPHRTDWLLIFSNPAAFAHPQGQARIVVRISGDSVSDAFTAIHVPEQWERDDRRQKNIMLLIRLICLFLLLVTGGFFIMRGKIARFSLPVAITALCFLVFASLVFAYSSWAEFVGQFNTSEPLGHQIFMLITGLSIGGLIRALIISLACGLVFAHNTTKILRDQYYQFFAGTTLGILLVGTMSLVTKITPSHSPLWASYDGLKFHNLIVTTIIANIVTYITLAAFALLLLTSFNKVESRWNLKTWIRTLILIGTGFAIAGALVFPTIPSWCIAGSIFGLLAWGAHHFVLRSYPQAIIPVIGIWLIAHNIKQTIFAAYPGTIAAHTGSIVVTALICTLLMHYAQKE